MATLLAKFRIDYSDVIAIPDVTKKASPETKAEFEKMIAGCGIPEEELKEEREKTNRYYGLKMNLKNICLNYFFRHLRLSELLRNYSYDSDMIVMTMPLPKKDHTSPALYMAWLDIMTRDLPPILLTRGNQEPVLTFYT